MTDRADRDWIRIELQAGETYTLTLHGIGPGPVADTVLTVYDAAGQAVARNDDADVLTGQLYSHLTFTPATSGTYTLAAAAYTGNAALDYAGRYELRVYDAAGAAPRTLAGSDADDAFLAGGPGDDTLSAGAGDDTLDGGPGADRLVGGPGQDTAWYGYAGAGVTVNLATGESRGGDAEGDTFGTQRLTVTDARGVTREVRVPDVERLHGSAHADTLTGNALANTLTGGDGDDTLDGGEGNDWLSGGAGADTLTGGDGFDAVSYAHSPAGVIVRLYEGTARGGHATGDTFPGRKSIIHTDAGGSARLIEVSDVEYLDGSAYNDILAGDRGDDRIEGRGGNDRLDGREGNDRLEGEAGADVLSGGPGQDTASYRYSDSGVTVRLHNGTARGGHAEGDTFAGADTLTVTDGDGTIRTLTVPDIERLHGGDHDDVLAGDVRDNTLNGGGGNDTLYGGPDGGDDALIGGAGDDRLFGGKGNDTLDGGDGHDALRGGPHADTLNGGTGNDTLAGGPGNDTLNGGAGNDTLNGGPGNDTLNGGAGNDTLEGGPGNDTLTGGAGNDTLAGGPGNDTLTGGAGADAFVFAPGGGDDAVTDFTHGDDRIDLSAFGDLDSINELTLQQRPDRLIIDLSGHGGGSVTLDGVAPDQLTETDLVFSTGEGALIG